MYYKNDNSITNPGDKTPGDKTPGDNFPIWLLVVLIIIFVFVGGCIIYMLRYNYLNRINNHVNQIVRNKD